MSKQLIENRCPNGHPFPQIVPIPCGHKGCSALVGCVPLDAGETTPDREALPDRPTRPHFAEWEDMAAYLETVEAENEHLRKSIANSDRDHWFVEVERLKAEALEVCGITYGMLTAGVVDDHDRIMRAANELAEFARRLTGAASALGEETR